MPLADDLYLLIKNMISTNTELLWETLMIDD